MSDTKIGTTAQKFFAENAEVEDEILSDETDGESAVVETPIICAAMHDDEE